MGYSVDQVLPPLVFSHLPGFDMLMFYLLVWKYKTDSQGAQRGIALQKVWREFIGRAYQGRKLHT